ncbi:MAG: hypothetical protein HZB92_04910 [Euryarchaeota archaeon]|nr:hypothetical protein [Euryarchaeota archaeon]
MIKMLVHTSALEQEIVSDEPYVKKLMELAAFPFVKIVFTPTQNPQIIQLFNEKHIEATSHQQLDTDFDYHILKKDDNFLNCSRNNDTHINPRTAIEITRILLVNLGLFYIKPNSPVNEGFYYQYRFKKIFPKYQFPWSVVVYTKGKSISESVYRQFDSLKHRLMFICRSADKASFYALKEPNNDTQDNTLYHFGYFIMLITGAFDDLAWIIKHLYSLDLKDPRYIGIKIPNDKTSTNFYKKLITNNKELHDYLTDSATQNIIKMMYPIRDTLQHREFIGASHLQHVQNNFSKNVFSIPMEAVKQIKAISEGDGRDYGFVFNDNKSCLVEPHLFITKIVENCAQIINNTLSLINWDRYLEVLSEDEIKKIRTSQKRFESGVGKSLGWGSEPICF